MAGSSRRIAAATPMACSHGAGAAQADVGALADLVAIDDEHVGAGARQLARDGEPRERRAADEDVGARHRPSAARAASHGRNRTRVPSTS